MDDRTRKNMEKILWIIYSWRNR